MRAGYGVRRPSGAREKRDRPRHERLAEFEWLMVRQSLSCPIFDSYMRVVLFSISLVFVKPKQLMRASLVTSKQTAEGVVCLVRPAIKHPQTYPRYAHRPSADRLWHHLRGTGLRSPGGCRRCRLATTSRHVPKAVADHRDGSSHRTRTHSRTGGAKAHRTKFRWRWLTTTILPMAGHRWHWAHTSDSCAASPTKVAIRIL